MANYYSILGVSWGADFDTIKSAYRRLAKRYHPDVSDGTDGASDKFNRLRTAYEVLSDPLARQAYDKSLWRYRKARRSQFVRSMLIGVAGALAVCALLLGYLPDDQDERSLKTTFIEQFAAFYSRGFEASESSEPHEHSEAFKLADALANSDGEETFAPRRGSLREIVIEELALAPLVAPISRFAMHEFAPGEFEVVGRMSNLTFGNGEPGEAKPGVSPTLGAGAKSLSISPPSRVATRKVEPSNSKPTIARAQQRDPQRPVLEKESKQLSGGIDEFSKVRVSPTAEKVASPRQFPETRQFPEKWTRQRFREVGLALSLPDGMFVPRLVAEDRRDIVFSSKSNRALLRVYRRTGRTRLSRQAVREGLVTHRYDGAELSENRLSADGIVLAGRLDGERFYERVYVDCNGRAAHAWMLIYPASQHVYYSPIVKKIAESHQRIRARGRRCSS